MITSLDWNKTGKCETKRKESNQCSKLYLRKLKQIKIIDDDDKQEQEGEKEKKMKRKGF